MKQLYRDGFMLTGFATLFITAWFTHDWALHLWETKFFLTITAILATVWLLLPKDDDNGNN